MKLLWLLLIPFCAYGMNINEDPQDTSLSSPQLVAHQVVKTCYLADNPIHATSLSHYFNHVIAEEKKKPFTWQSLLCCCKKKKADAEKSSLLEKGEKKETWEDIKTIIDSKDRVALSKLVARAHAWHEDTLHTTTRHLAFFQGTFWFIFVIANTGSLLIRFADYI